jgi:hypothetical protein
VLADKRDGESGRAHQPSSGRQPTGLDRCQIRRLEALNGVLRRRVPVKIERNERQRCLIKNAGSWRIWSRSEPAKRRNHSGATTCPR